MKTRRYTLALSALALAAASFSANAAIVFQNLGTSAPPASIAGRSMLPFNQAAQEAIPNYTNGISVIPGSPVPGNLSISPAAYRFTPGDGWFGSGIWGRGYVGPVFYSSQGPITLTLPANARAFYFYVQPDTYGTWNVTATTNSGATSGAVSVDVYDETGAAKGFAFYSTAGETITSITISNDSQNTGGAVAEFGISTANGATTCASEGYTGTKLTWCKNICEMGYTGATLDMWIHRWINRYRDLPYCAQEGGGEEEPPPQEA